VELLVVIVILGVLAAIVVFAVGGISDKGDSAAAKTDCAVLQAAEEAYFANNSTNHYTDKEQDLVDAGFLHSVSTKHPSITLTTTAGGAQSYTIGGCP
jgi:general secretion pathway protein G